MNSPLSPPPSPSPAGDSLLRVLIVEDTPADAELMALRLKQEGFRLIWQRVETELEYLRELEQPYDLILSDWSLPQFSGLKALQIMRERGMDRPFILVSGSIGEEAAVAAMRLGAYDYLLKDRLDRLGQAVKNALEQKRTREEYRKASKALEASEAELRALFASMRDVVLVIDREGVYLKIAPTNPELLYRPADELLGKRLDELFPPEQAGAFLQTIRRVLETRRTEIIEYELEIGGRSIWFETSVSPMTPESVIWVARDISERKRHLRRQEALAMLGRELAALRDPALIARTALRALEPMIGCAYFAVALINHEPRALQILYAALEGVELDVRLYPLLELDQNRPGSICAQVIEARKPLIFTDPLSIQNGLVGLLNSQGEEMRSACCLPMMAEDRVIGLVELQSPKEEEYQPEDLEWLSVAVNQVGLSIQNAILFAREQQRVSELMALQKIDSAVVAHLSPQQTLEILLDQVVGTLRVDAAAILRYNPVSQALEYAHGRGFRTPVIETTCLPLQSEQVMQTVLRRRILHGRELRGGTDFFKQGVWAGEGFNNYLAVPLVSGARLIGVCELYHRESFHADADWLRMLETLAGQAALVVEHLQIFQDLQRLNADLLKAYDDTIAGWSQAMDLRDKETENHTRRVTELTVRLARELGMSEEQIQHVRRGALLHDIGKLGVPDAILSKVDALTAEEWEVMRRHPQMAYEMLYPIEYLRPALDIPYCHHEKWDGSGYPSGLKGEEIPLAARMFTLADVYDALTSDRPYRKAWSRPRALNYLREQAGKHFDPRLVEVFFSLLQTGELE
ncbi:protein containig PAS domain S-box [Anaerolinea thermolimosa]|uniref:HD domain-containing phosphohydrolase n=1 Tax=Anaerolinea thermolimosa TaxID=229919 RepID=UPI000784625F|nr:HD domain-containing phosphohydrolase [Anaerolinea thermolimosa]GAP07799.1 protein containig PAS domain S-box [Anaerolinea thermolimosa]